MSAMTSEVIWLIVISFFFAKGFEKTGLGERLANIFVSAMGKSTLGLAYGLSLAELLLSPALPSTTARAGGLTLGDGGLQGRCLCKGLASAFSARLSTVRLRFRVGVETQKLCVKQPADDTGSSTVHRVLICT
jgi:di/tricarboxylate transporter